MHGNRVLGYTNKPLTEFISHPFLTRDTLSYQLPSDHPPRHPYHHQFSQRQPALWQLQLT